MRAKSSRTRLLAFSCFAKQATQANHLSCISQCRMLTCNIIMPPLNNTQMQPISTVATRNSLIGRIYVRSVVGGANVAFVGC
ncbi:hypothetical protein F5Y08DRAFT_319566 [Xylaria arbuscula]|nr:hypothetical protein F5Y08DRAFT_319566 [Xylaria arbuscula]